MAIAPVDQANKTMPFPPITYPALVPVQRKTDRVARKNILINNFFADTELLRNDGSRIRLKPLLNRPNTPFNLRENSPIPLLNRPNTPFNLREKSPIPLPSTRHLLKPITEKISVKNEKSISSF